MSVETTFEAMATMRRSHTLMHHELGEFQVSVQQGHPKTAEECRHRAHAAMDALCDSFIAAHTGRELLDQK
jgi:DNA gyrase inhibitor GyrI